MAIADPITFAWNATNVTLNRINQDGYGSVYYGELSPRKFTLEVKQTIPKVGEYNESHLLKLTVQVYDATTGAYIRTVQAWSVVKTLDAAQDQEECEDAYESLVDFLSDANITKLVGRQS